MNCLIHSSWVFEEEPIIHKWSRNRSVDNKIMRACRVYCSCSSQSLASLIKQSTRISKLPLLSVFSQGEISASSAWDWQWPFFLHSQAPVVDTLHTFLGSLFRPRIYVPPFPSVPTQLVSNGPSTSVCWETVSSCVINSSSNIFFIPTTPDISQEWDRSLWPKKGFWGPHSQLCVAVLHDEFPMMEIPIRHAH